MEEFIFPSHTSVISTSLLVEKMKELGMNAEMPQPIKKSVSLDNVSEQSVSKLQKKIELKMQLRDTILMDEFVSDIPE